VAPQWAVNVHVNQPVQRRPAHRPTYQDCQAPRSRTTAGWRVDAASRLDRCPTYRDCRVAPSPEHPRAGVDRCRRPASVRPLPDISGLSGTAPAETRPPKRGRRNAPAETRPPKRARRNAAGLRGPAAATHQYPTPARHIRIVRHRAHRNAAGPAWTRCYRTYPIRPCATPRPLRGHRGEPGGLEQIATSRTYRVGECARPAARTSNDASATGRATSSIRLRTGRPRAGSSWSPGTGRRRRRPRSGGRS